MLVVLTSTTRCARWSSLTLMLSFDSEIMSRRYLDDATMGHEGDRRAWRWCGDRLMAARSLTPYFTVFVLPAVVVLSAVGVVGVLRVKQIQ